jgi:WD40 repeat protein
MSCFNIRTVRLLTLVLGISLTLAAVPASASLFVSSDFFNVVGEYDPVTGLYAGPFTSSVNAIGQLGVKLNAAGDRMLVGAFNGGVDEFDANTGAYIKTYNPGPGTQWAGLYAPNGNVYISSWNTNDVREYDVNTGAFVRVVTSSLELPSDMRVGPNGNLFICSYGGSFVKEVDAITGALVNQWSQPAPSRTNDIDFLPSGEMLVTALGSNKVYRYDTAYNLLGTFNGTGWGNTHGIEVSPFDGNIYVVDGISSQVHSFDPVTFAELDATFLNPGPGGKIVDLAFRIPEPTTLALLVPVMMLIRRRRR